MKINDKGHFLIISAEAQKLADFHERAARAGLAGRVLPGCRWCIGWGAAREKAAELLAELTFGLWEQRLLSRLAERRYDYFSAGERRLLLQKAWPLTREDDFFWGLFAGPQRVERLAQALAEQLRHSSRLQLEGFTRFRLAGYQEYLHTLLSIAADEMLAEQEDEECLLLLRGFLTGRPLGGEIHVFLLRQGRYDICASSGGRLHYLEGGLLQGCEDMLVSALLQLAPRQLYLHMEQPLPVALHKLLRELFGTRLTLEMPCGQPVFY